MLELRCISNRFAVDIILKVALFDSTIRELHFANPMLNTMLPFTLVAAAICPVHFTVAVPFVIFVATFVLVATFPSEGTESTLFIILILTLVRVAARSVRPLFPFTLTVFHSISKLTDIDGGVLPLILASATRLTIYILAYVRITVCKHISSLSVL